MYARPADARQQVGGSSGRANEAPRGWRSTIMSGASPRCSFAVVGKRPPSARSSWRRRVQRVGAQPLPRDLNEGACARARLGRQIHDCLQRKRRHFLDRPLAESQRIASAVSHEVDLVAAQDRRSRRSLLHDSWISHSSRPSISRGAPERFATATSAGFLRRNPPSIGSSRWPRSTSTDELIAFGRPNSISASSAAANRRPVSGHRPPAGFSCRDREGYLGLVEYRCAPTAVRIRSVAVERDGRARR